MASDIPSFPKKKTQGNIDAVPLVVEIKHAYKNPSKYKVNTIPVKKIATTKSINLLSARKSDIDAQSIDSMTV